MPDQQIRDRTPLERVYEEVFDDSDGLKARVTKIDKRTEFLDDIRKIFGVLKLPFGILATILLSAVGAWLVQQLGLGQ